MNKFGLQLWSVREDMNENLLDTIRNVAAMGYSGVQFAGFGTHTAEAVKEVMDEVNITAMGAHVQLDDLMKDFDGTVAYHKTIGNEDVIIPHLPEDMRGTPENYKKTALLLNRLGEDLSDKGLTLGYHNHDFEFDEYNGKTGLDIMFEHTDKDYLKMELDCFWASYTYNDPIMLLDKYGDRCVSLHIKDLKIEDEIPVSTELGTGTLPLLSYMQKGKELGVKYFIVEQEHFTSEPLLIAAENAKYMIETMKEII